MAERAQCRIVMELAKGDVACCGTAPGAHAAYRMVQLAMRQHGDRSRIWAVMPDGRRVTAELAAQAELEALAWVGRLPAGMSHGARTAGADMAFTPTASARRPLDERPPADEAGTLTPAEV